MAAESTQFQIHDGKTFFIGDGFEKLVLEAVITPTEADDPEQIGLHIDSMWLDEPASIEIPRASLADRHEFSNHVSTASQPMIRFHGNQCQLHAFVAEQLGVE